MIIIPVWEPFKALMGPCPAKIDKPRFLAIAMAIKSMIIILILFVLLIIYRNSYS